jgi:hypothetical protein
MKKIYLSIAILTLMVKFAQAQLTLDGEFRPRTEYRHGYGNIIADGAEAGFATSTRIRLNTGFAAEGYKLYVSLQDVITWGENRQLLSVDDNNSFAIFEAWADINIGSGWSTKLGRQTIVYDDQRIFGSVGWAQQARNHDAALVKYKKDKFMLDFGLAFNQDLDGNPTNLSGFNSVGTAYNTAGFFSYKAMQYVYLKQQWEKFSASFLGLNSTFQDLASGISTGTTSSLVTLGSHLDYKAGGLGLAGNIYYQLGERQNGVNVKGAYLASLDLSFKASSKVGLGLGAEIISGKTDDSAAFFPLYGTNHKFNGFMDYFYVGNHGNSVGLVDIHASANFKLSEKSGLLVKVLNFSGVEDLPSGEKSLGTELDLVFSTKLKGAGLAIGYSQMFASDGMYELKGTTKAASADGQNWAWAMLTIKPNFLNGTK